MLGTYLVFVYLFILLCYSVLLNTNYTPNNI